MKNLILRTLSSVVMIVSVTFLYRLGQSGVYSLIIIISIIEYQELRVMLKRSTLPIMLCSLIMIVIPNASFIYIYSTDERVIPWLALSIWSTDIAAYFFGKFMGKRKMAPRISPKKTWEGLVGGIFAATITASACAYYLHLPLICYGAGPLVAIIGQSGDLLESALKRSCNVNDSGSIIPGHGGVLDRLDSFILLLPMLAFIV